MMTYKYNLSTQETEITGLQIPGQPRCIARAHLKKKKYKEENEISG